MLKGSGTGRVTHGKSSTPDMSCSVEREGKAHGKAATSVITIEDGSVAASPRVL